MTDAIDLLIEGRARDLGGFEVRRVLPYAKRRTVGCFIFWDELGPAQFPPGDGIDVRPHPHIGLATVTYLFEGELTHKDNLGFEQVIRPGDVNWMTAGRGIVHSERTGPEARAGDLTMHAIQSWVALPQNDEEAEPAFHHHPKSTLPVIEREGVRMRLIAGAAYGETAPVTVFADMFYLDVELTAGGELALPAEYAERAVYPVSGDVTVNGAPVAPHVMAVLAEGGAPTLAAKTDARVMLLGGAPLDGPRHIFWNLVSSSKERIEQAKADWRASAAAGWRDTPFTLPPGEEEFIPLPEE